MTSSSGENHAPSLMTLSLIDNLREHMTRMPKWPGGAAPEGVYEEVSGRLIEWTRRRDSLRQIIAYRLLDDFVGPLDD